MCHWVNLLNNSADKSWIGYNHYMMEKKIIDNWSYDSMCCKKKMMIVT